MTDAPDAVPAPAPTFQARLGLLEEMAALQETSALSVLSGGHGTGKSQIAARYARA